ncbi:MAG TPA: decaprenyl-phosphate phosphoribosyltransferase [Candidatus Polarisedimenticolia bacterium]|jgi:4-hydroxybenzoate polyprenyltransferase|nr:decaprenyl-phosphate phosphoribosyltransferase [Candidatus Polarisedimenticolia bacterium]
MTARRPPMPLALLRAMRPRQWIKNLVVFAALVFALRLRDRAALERATLAFVLFCATSGAVYVMNDLFDVERDRRHPRKSRRPIASGDLGMVPAGVAVAVLLTVSLLVGFTMSPPFGAVLLIYTALNLAYSMWLKEVVILDVMVIAAGFVLRAVGGALVIDVAISTWLVMCTILLSLFLAFTKRRQELETLDDPHEHRVILREYSVAFLDQMINVVTASTLVTYMFYTMSPEVEQKLGTDKLYLTVPFVLYGIFRYLYLVHRRAKGASPTQALLTDGPLLACVGLWGATVILLIYVHVGI